eukprot:7668954-Lingulodinium_polyedra.AAC.1
MQRAGGYVSHVFARVAMNGQLRVPTFSVALSKVASYSQRGSQQTAGQPKPGTPWGMGARS